MKILLLLLPLLLVVSCTGTPEDEPPIFVIAGVQNGSDSQLVLFEDAYKTALDSTRFKLFTKVTLNAPAIAFDIVDRVNTRSELVVLTREDDGTSFLEFFSLLGIQEAADFTETTSKQVDLSTLTDLPTTVDLCPTSIQITRDGTLAAITNNPELCDGPANKVSIFLIDLKNKKYLNQITINTFDVFPLSPLPTTLDQSNNTLYFLSTGAIGVTLNRLSDSNFSSSNLDSAIFSYPTSIQTNRNQVDFIKRSSDAFILNRSQNIYSYSAISGDTIENANVPTLSQGRSFVHDYSNQYNQVFVLNGQRIAIHQDPKATTTPNRIEGSTTSTLGTINTFTDFMYLARDNVLEVYDLLELEGNPTTVALEVETVSENSDLADLNNPSILTWVQGVIAIQP